MRIPISELGITTEDPETTTTTTTETPTPEPEIQEIAEIQQILEIQKAQDFQGFTVFNPVDFQDIPEVQTVQTLPVTTEVQTVQTFPVTPEVQTVQTPEIPEEFQTVQTVQSVQETTSTPDSPPIEITTFKPTFIFSGLNTVRSTVVENSIPSTETSLKNTIQVLPSFDDDDDEEDEDDDDEEYYDSDEDYDDDAEEFPSTTEADSTTVEGVASSDTSTRPQAPRFTFHFDQNPVRPDFEALRVKPEEPVRVVSSEEEPTIIYPTLEITTTNEVPATTATPITVTTRRGKARKQLEVYEGVSIRQIPPSNLLKTNVESITDPEPVVVDHEGRPEIVLGTFQNLMQMEDVVQEGPAAEDFGAETLLSVYKTTAELTTAAPLIQTSRPPSFARFTPVQVTEPVIETTKPPSFVRFEPIIDTTTQPGFVRFTPGQVIDTTTQPGFVRFEPAKLTTTADASIETTTFPAAQSGPLTKSDRLKIIQEKLREANSTGRRGKKGGSRKKLGRRVNLNPTDFPSFKLGSRLAIESRSLVTESSQTSEEGVTTVIQPSEESLWKKLTSPSRRPRKKKNKKFGSKINTESLLL